MTAPYRVLERRDLTESDSDRFAADVLIGLTSPRKFLPSQYFYDDRGSELFQQITAQPEYYPTGCEREIFQTHKEALAHLVEGAPFNLVELGAGDGQKTSVLIEHFRAQGAKFDYIPIDISEGAIQDLTDRFSRQYEGMTISGLVTEYFDGIKWIKRHTKARNLVLFLGSNIGNFEMKGARRFLTTLWNATRAGDFLYIGFDLRKDVSIVSKAYDDAAGVTRAFNLNLLERINRELAGEFDLAKFHHHAQYNFSTDAMESFLVSTEPQTVRIGRLRRSFEFDAWESIHVENSHKYSLRTIEALAQRTGFEVVQHLHDERRWFCGSVWKTVKS